MIEVVRRFIGCCLLLAATTAHAGFISGNQVLANGNQVALQGLEWMPLSYSAGKTVNEVEGGFTDNTGTVWAASDWRYATAAEVTTLLSSLLGAGESFYSPGASNVDGVSWFFSNFGSLGVNYDGTSYSGFFYGNTDVWCPVGANKCRPWGVVESDGVVASLAAWYVDYPLDWSSRATGHLLVRSATSVPESSGLVLLLIGAVALCFARYRQRG